ncbi:uncharacterized protein LOC135849920 [Planococcus citri]|uniref:uncharacterized protein LOC135849920 n=1 Tax=Planococcus citri TaxID=170843 RepID=UPI0031F86A5B
MLDILRCYRYKDRIILNRRDYCVMMNPYFAEEYRHISDIDLAEDNENVLLPYDPEVDNFGSKILEAEAESGQTITYEEAFLNADYVEKALQVPPIDVPIEFTMFVLRKMAVNEKDFRSFVRAIPLQTREYLHKLIKRESAPRVKVHPANDKESTSTFRGIFTKIFCKKVISNFAENQEDKHYDKIATVFPFKVSRLSTDVRWCEMKIMQQFDDDFYQEIQEFLDEHFDNVNAREAVELFLLNIRNFISDKFSAEALLTRRENPGGQHDDYLSTFPRLHQGGIERFQFLYREFVNMIKSNRIYVPGFYFYRYGCDEDYFRRLPERNFVDLYSFLDYVDFFKEHREIYMRRFKKYLFFFVHALAVESNPVFFIDEMLFECLKSLRTYKTVKEDIKIKNDLAMISMLHLRMNLNRGSSKGNYCLSDTALERMKHYILESIVPKNPQLNVKYKTDLLTWMPFRTKEACFNVCYSKKSSNKNFLERLLCSIMCPDSESIRYIDEYNAYLGKVYRFDLSMNDIESLRNFVRLCNTYDVSNEPLEETNLDVFMLNLFIKFIETERSRATLECE